MTGQQITTEDLDSRIATMQQSWYGWGSPVGLGLGFALAVAGIAALAAAFGRGVRRARLVRP